MALRRRDQSLTRFLACFKKRWLTNRLFIPTALYVIVSGYCAIVDSFVIVSFFSWETLHSAILSLTNKLNLCLFKPMFWSRCDKTVHLGLLQLILYIIINRCYACSIKSSYCDIHTTINTEKARSSRALNLCPRACSWTRLLYGIERVILPPTIHRWHIFPKHLGIRVVKSCKCATRCQGTSRLGSVFMTLRWFGLALISTQAIVLRKVDISSNIS